MSATGSYKAGAQIPITRTFVQGSVTTAVGLVGQVLNNGQTNWVGVENGKADYLLTASVANAIETTLADGNTYYFSSGSAPAGYLLTTGGATVASSAGSSSHTGTGSSAATTGATTSHPGTSSTGAAATTHTSSSTASGASAATTTGAAQRLSGGAILSLGLALFTAVSMNFMF